MTDPTYEDVLVLMGVPQTEVKSILRWGCKLIATNPPSKAVLEAYDRAKSSDPPQAFAVAFTLGFLMVAMALRNKQ